MHTPLERDIQQTRIDNFIKSRFEHECQVPKRNEVVMSRMGDSTVVGRVAKTGHPNEKRKIGSIRDFTVPVEYYLVPRCTRSIDGKVCGSPALRKRGRNTSGRQRYECAKGHRFVVHSIYDEFDPAGMEIFLNVLCACGRFSEAYKVASKTGLKATLRQARRIIRYVRELTQNFENQNESLKIPINEMIADETYQRVRGKRRTRLHSHAWVIVLYEPYFRYVVEAHVCKGRTFPEVKKAFEAMATRCRNFAQKILRTDGFSVYEKLAEKYEMILSSKKKDTDFGFINKVERLFSYLRTIGLRKTASFPYGMLIDLIGIFRAHNNYFKRYEVLNSRTPFEAATGLSFRSWHHLITAAEMTAPLPKKYGGKYVKKTLELFSG